MRNDLQEKINKLREIHVSSSPEAQAQIAKWEASVRRIALKTEYAKMQVTIEIVRDAKRRVSGINSLLMNDRNLTDVQRQALFEKREVYEWYLKLLDVDSVDAALKEIDDAVSFELEGR